jgi:hypothetical protein
VSAKTPARGGILLVVLIAAAAPAALADEAGIKLEVGVAFDDNPFLTPSEPYFDQFDEVIVEPVPSSGFFVPLTVSGDYRVGVNSRWVLDYRLRHHAYGEEQKSADETYARVATGLEWATARKRGRENVFFLLPYAAYRKEIFFDRDTGVGEVIGFEDASDRYTYLATGGDIGFSSRLSRTVQWELAARYEQRDYEDVPSLTTLDHQRYRVGAELSVRFHRRLKLYLDYRYQLLDYEERPSRGLDGGIAGDGPPLEYGYHLAGATFRVKPADTWTLHFDVDYGQRIDAFQGYNDYASRGGGLRLRWGRRRTRFLLDLRHRRREYPRAFIFDKEVNPGTGLENPKKAYDTADARVRIELPSFLCSRFFLEVEGRLQEAADPRYTYQRLRAGTGLEWRF